MRNLILYILLCLLFLSIPAYACLNDRDTVLVEDKGLLEVYHVITGRFERNPPEYYQIRIKRLRTGLIANPNRIDDYDDVAVACDRIGLDDEGLAWMDAKLKHLTPYNPTDEKLKEDWYRYYANTGTLRIHRWLRAGGDIGRMAEVVQAKNEIGKALEIKPLAHFGREKYQYQVMNWIIDNYQKPNPVPLEDYLKGDTDEILKGLCGLVVLGNAWESVDIFQTISILLKKQSNAEASYMAYLRVCELEKMGRRSLINRVTSAPELMDLDSADSIKSDYAKMRTNADKYIKNRNNYMLTLLKMGTHPDTDRGFWTAYTETNEDEAYTRLSTKTGFRLRSTTNNSDTFPLIMLGIIIGCCVVIIIKRRLARV